MRQEFKDYIEKKRKKSFEHNARNTRAVEVLESFIKLVEDHSHYKIINSRVTKKFTHDRWYVSLSNEYGSNKVKFSGYIDNLYEEIIVYMRDSDYTPKSLIERMRDSIESYKRGISDKDYKEEERILGEIDKIIGDNSFVNDVINYGMYNR